MWVQESDTFLGGTDKEIREKRNFFVNRSVPKNFQWENFSDRLTLEGAGGQTSDNFWGTPEKFGV